MSYIENCLYLEKKIAVRYIHSKIYQKKNSWNNLPGSVPFFKMTIIGSDNLRVFVGNNMYAPKHEDIMLFAPDELHFANISYDGILEYFEFYFPEDAFSDFASSKSLFNAFLKKMPNQNMICLSEYQKKILKSFIEICKAHENISNNIYLLSCSLQLLHIIKEAFENQYLSLPYGTFPPILCDILDEINNHFKEWIRLDELAKTFSVSPVYVNRIFKHYIGCAPYEYILGRRVANARKLLEEGKSVTEACFDSGFSDCSRFISRFKKEIGKTPLQYKKTFE